MDNKVCDHPGCSRSNRDVRNGCWCVYVRCHDGESDDCGDEKERKGEGPCTTLRPRFLVLGAVLFIDLSLVDELREFGCAAFHPTCG